MWQEKLSQLREAGMSWAAIGRACKVGRSTIHDLYTGRTKNPTKEVGSRLKRLHTVKTNKAD
jgi:hypothetical protein